MKNRKSFAVLSVIATVLFATGTASALDTRVALDTIWVNGTKLRLSSPGGLIAAGPPESGYCTYQVEWLNPLNPFDLQVCNIRETRPLGTTCAAASIKDIDTVIESDPVAGCTGFNAAGAALPTQLTLVELKCYGGVRLLGVAAQGTAMYPIVVKGPRVRLGRPR